MELLRVTDLTSQVYCSRALYLQKVLGIKEPLNQAMIKGGIRHGVYDGLNGVEEKLVLNVTEGTSQQQLLNNYKLQFAALLKSNILRRKEQLIMLGIYPGRLFFDMWPYLLEESVERARNIFSFVEKEQLFGEQLWLSIEPKIVTELSVKSEELMLKGVVDKVEIYKDRYVPYELKTGTAPREGIWPEHRIQLAAYMLLLRHKFGIEINSGVVHYLDIKKKQELTMNPFMEEEIKQLTKNTFETLNSGNLPKICPNPKKCLRCGLRNTCRNEAALRKMLETKHLNTQLLKKSL